MTNNLNRNIWCIEMCVHTPHPKGCLLEPKHMMYWNRAYRDDGAWQQSWTETYDVLKLKRVTLKHNFWKRLNRNIWCIEITVKDFEIAKKFPWTETYDVLKLRGADFQDHTVKLEPKHMMYWNNDTANLKERVSFLNRNIWCIEIHIR